MKIRMIALAGAAALALSGPASASDATGWYLGVAAGPDWAGNMSVKEVAPNPNVVDFHTQNGALVTGSFGYKFHDHIRFEGEIGWTEHRVDPMTIGNFTYSGHTRDSVCHRQSLLRLGIVRQMDVLVRRRRRCRKKRHGHP